MRAQKLSRTQPCCDPCWIQRYGAREANRIRTRADELCCFCGTLTRSGIYERVDPATVRYPT